MHSSGPFEVWFWPAQSVSQDLPVLDLCETNLCLLKEIILNVPRIFLACNRSRT